MYSKIETERLILREWKMEDIDILVDGLNHFDTAKNLTVPFPYTKEHAVVFIGKHLKNNKKSFRNVWSFKTNTNRRNRKYRR